MRSVSHLERGPGRIGNTSRHQEDPGPNRRGQPDVSIRYALAWREYIIPFANYIYTGPGDSGGITKYFPTSGERLILGFH